MKRGSRKFVQGPYVVQNPQKYLGKGRPIYRSSWEQRFMLFCDTNDHILEWASEPLRIPYRNIMGKQTTYVPDFLIRYRNKHNQVITELIEIKPFNQSVIQEGQNANLRATVANNQAKWAMARAWCQKQGIKFRIITEREMFGVPGK